MSDYDEHLISMAGGDGEASDQIAAIEARADAATKGPWHFDGDVVQSYHGPHRNGGGMSGLLGVAAHRKLPEGETIGAIFWHCGEKYYVTQSEVDRIKNLPSADEVRSMLARIDGLVVGRATP